jgi:agmatinase
MDRDKLDKLRALYGVVPPGDVHDPKFKKVADMVFAGTDRRPKPYEGVSTFLGAPCSRLPRHRIGQGLDVALVGVPMDLGVTNRAGARLGPRCRARRRTHIGAYHPRARVAPLTGLGWRRRRRASSAAALA